MNKYLQVSLNEMIQHPEPCMETCGIPQSLESMSGENTFAMYGSLPMIFFFNINLARGDDARLL